MRHAQSERLGHPVSSGSSGAAPPHRKARTGPAGRKRFSEVTAPLAVAPYAAEEGGAPGASLERQRQLAETATRSRSMPERAISVGGIHSREAEPYAQTADLLKHSHRDRSFWTSRFSGRTNRTARACQTILAHNHVR